MEKNISRLIGKQRSFYDNGRTRNVPFRKEQLLKLKSALTKYEDRMLEAARKDMGRANVESYFMEINTNMDELNNAIKNLEKWSATIKVRTPFLFFGSKSYIQPEAFGVTLIISAWNYPFLQLFSPLIGAISAGNTAVLKPAPESACCSGVATEIIRETFDEEYVALMEGDASVTTALLDARFDKIFFTGSPRIGRIIHAAANRNLTPVTLELGGKSPAIVDETADLKSAAKKIVWAKLFNVGQVCVSVDHVYVKEEVREHFIKQCKEWIKEFYGENPKKSKDYGVIISERNFDRVAKLIDGAKVLYGGSYSKESRYIEPTIVYPVSEEDPLMQEEIFGPVLPILTFESVEELIKTQTLKEKPLALYIFSTSQQFIDRIVTGTSSGGVTINDCMSHGGTTELPFGGVGNSGMGNYHGKYTFDAFTHYKSVMKASSNKLLDLALKYPPYSGKLESIRKLKKWHII